MPDENIVIKTLTSEEIQTLQTDAALRLLGEHSAQLVIVNSLISAAMKDVLCAKIKLQDYQQTKETLIELMRAEKAIAQHS